MGKILTPDQAAAELRMTNVETLRRWRRANIGPPFVIHGNKPKYRSDLLQPGTYAVCGRVDKFASAKIEVMDGANWTPAEAAMFDQILEKAPVMEWEVGDSLVLVSTMEDADLNNPLLKYVLNDMAMMKERKPD